MGCDHDDGRPELLTASSGVPDGPLPGPAALVGPSAPSAPSAEARQAAPPPRPTDEELLTAWRQGDVAAGQRLWRRHSDSVRRFYRNKVPWAVALDLTQRTIEACLRAHERILSFRSYVLGVARRQLLGYLRAEQRKKQRHADLETLVLDDTVGNPEEWMGAKREKRALLRALRQLPLPQQLVLELYYWEPLTASAIAEILGWPKGTVKTRIAAAKEALKLQIQRLAASPAQLRSTMDDLDAWAARTHDHLFTPAAAKRGVAPPAEPLVVARGSGPIEVPEGAIDGDDYDEDDDGPLPPLPLDHPASR